MASRLPLPSAAMLQGGAGGRPGRELEGASARAGVVSRGKGAPAVTEVAGARPAPPPGLRQQAVLGFIEGVHPWRRHSALGYDSPVRFERRREQTRLPG
jgi:transposase InsO family protein